MQVIIAPLLGPIGTAALVLLLVIFMLLKREDLRRRLSVVLSDEASPTPIGACGRPAPTRSS